MEVTDDKVKAYITKTADYALQQAENVDADIAGGAKSLFSRYTSSYKKTIFVQKV